MPTYVFHSRLKLSFSRNLFAVHSCVYDPFLSLIYPGIMTVWHWLSLVVVQWVDSRSLWYWPVRQIKPAQLAFNPHLLIYLQRAWAEVEPCRTATVTS